MTSVTVVGDARLLRLALRLDALTCAVNGLVYLAVSGPVGRLLGVPSGVLVGLGAFLAVCAVFFWRVSAADPVRRPAVLSVIGVNTLWVVDSLVVAAAGWFDLTTVGTVWVVLQAAVVAGLAVAQYAGLRRALG